MLPEPDNTVILNLLFEFCTFHGLAKLRLHTESTLRHLENSTARLGCALRIFKNTVCEKYETAELPLEEAARGRRNANLTAKGKQTDATQGKRTRKKKEFNMHTYKFHSLGDYAQSIRMFGTTDNTSTQQVNFHLESASILL